MKPTLPLIALSAFGLGVTSQAAPLPSGFHEGKQPVGNGAVIHYVRGGRGEPLVLVHGFGESARMWRPYLALLGKEYTVLTPDLPGMEGSSFMPNGEYDMKRVAQRLHEFVRRQGFKRIRLVGHDIGLMAVFAYAEQYPDEVSKLALIEAPIPGIGKTWPEVFNNPALWHFHFPNSPIALKLVKGRERTFLDHFWISFSGNPKAVAIPETERQTYARLYAKPGTMAAMLGYFKNFPVDAQENAAFVTKGKLTMPILAIAAERSMNDALERQAKEVAENVQSHIVPKAGHWLMEERPEAIKGYLLPFLRSGTARRGSASEFCGDSQNERLTPREIATRASIGAGAGTSGVSGIQTRVLKGDPTKPGLYTIELRVPARTTIQAHTHPDERVATVVSGVWSFGYGSRFDAKSLKSLPAGSFYTEPAGVAHFARTGNTPVLVHITGVGPTGTEYVKEARP